MSEKNLLCVALVLESGQRREAKIFEDGTYRIGNGPYMKMEAQEFEMARILERRSQRTHWLMANAYEIEDVKVGSEPPVDYVEDLGPFTEADFLIPDTPIVPKEAVAPEEEKNEAPGKRKKFLFFGGKKKAKAAPEPAAAEKVPDTADESPTAKWVTEEPSAPTKEGGAPADTPAAEPVTEAEVTADTEATPSDAAKPDEKPEQKSHGKKKKGRGKGEKQAEAPKEDKDTAQAEEPPPPAKEPQKKKPVWFVWVLIACVLLAVLGWFGGNAVREHMGMEPPAPFSAPEPTPEPTPAPPARPQIYITIDATEGAEVSGSADVDVSGVDAEDPEQDDGEDDSSSPASSAVPDNKEE